VALNFTGGVVANFLKQNQSMDIDKNIFFKHKTSITDGNWKVDLFYENSDATNKEIDFEKAIEVIDITGNGDLYSAIKIDVFSKNTPKKSCILTGIDGGFILYGASEKESNGQTILINHDNLILSIGFTLISIDLQTFEINWKIRPDIAEIFEFYKLENHILLRGELGIHRIDFNGNIKWSFTARDIWVNMNGKEEVKINVNTIKLIDWDDNEYLIDYDGILLSEKQKINYREVDFKKEPKLWLKLKLKSLLKYNLKE